MITRGSGSAVRIGATVRAVRTWVVVLGMGCAVSISGWAAGQQAGAEPSTDVESQHAGPAPATQVDAFDLHDPRTPAGALRSYIDACRGTDFTAAAQRLNLAGVDPAERAARGPQLARLLPWHRTGPLLAKRLNRAKCPTERCPAGGGGGARAAPRGEDIKSHCPCPAPARRIPPARVAQALPCVGTHKDREGG